VKFPPGSDPVEVMAELISKIESLQLEDHANNESAPSPPINFV